MSEAKPLLFNPLDPAFRADPYPFYDRLRSEDPVHQAGGRWVISRYADCVSLMRDPRSSSDATKSGGYARSVVERGGSKPDKRLLAMRPFLILDPPDHTRLRGLVSKAFTPRVVEGLRPRIQQLVDELLDKAADAGSMEVIEDLAYPLPVTMICELLGVPPEDRSTFKEWSRDLARGQDPPEVMSPDVAKRSVQAMSSLMAFFGDLCKERRKSPRDDLLSALIAAEEEGDRLTEEELLATCVFLLAAGHETTVNLIGNGALALLRHPDQLERLRDDPSLAPSAVEEFLRYDPPTQLAWRTALEEIEIGGRTIGEGQQIILLLAAANRDPDQFSHPERLDIARADNHHLAFGHGIHFCLGAPLARIEGEIALGTLVRRFRGLEVRTEALEYEENIVLRGLRSLPVGFAGAVS